jgi:hypothetical protein
MSNIKNILSGPLYEISTKKIERINFLKNTNIYKKVLEPSLVDLNNFKKYKYKNTINFFLKSGIDESTTEKLFSALDKYILYFNEDGSLKFLEEIGTVDMMKIKKQNKSVNTYLINDLEKYIQEHKNISESNIKKKEKEVIEGILQRRINGLKKCSQEINETKYEDKELFNKLQTFLNTEHNIEKETLNNETINIENKLQKLKFTPNDTKEGCNYDTNFNDEYNFSYIIEKYLKLQNGRVFLLGSMINKGILNFCQKYFFYSEKLFDIIYTKNNTECSEFVYWTEYLNTLYLLLISRSKLAISGMIYLPEDKHIKYGYSILSKRRIDLSHEMFSNKEFIGYIIIPYKLQKSLFKSSIIEINVFMFKDKITNKISFYDKNIGVLRVGSIYRDTTVLVDEMKMLYKHLNVKFYYDKNTPKFLYLSNKTIEDLKTNGYNNLIEIFFDDNQETSFNNNVYNKKKYKQGQITLYYFENGKKIILLKTFQVLDGKYVKNIKSNNINNVNKVENKIGNNVPIMSAGSNKLLLYEKLDKIKIYQYKIQKEYFSNNRDKYNEFISNNYLISKYKYPSIKKYVSTNSKIFSISKNKNIKIDFDKLLDNQKTIYVYKYYPYTFGYYRSYEIVYNDILNFKNKTIAEISTLPSFFEVFKKLFNKKIDLYLTDRNYFSMDKTEWQKLILVYKSKISDNILYNSNINKKYDILIINLLLYMKDEYIPKDMSITTGQYMFKYIEDEVYNTNKEEIKYLKYLNKGGSLYIYFFTISNKEIFDLYISLGKEFENIEIFIDKYSDHHFLFGGIWLKCYNYKSKNRISKSDLIKKYEIFYNKYYNNKYKWFETFEKFIIEYQNSSEKNIDNLKKKVLNKQLLVLKNISNDFNIELNPIWEKFIYINFFLVNAFKSINYRYNSNEEYQNLFRTFSTQYAYEKYQIVKSQNNIYLNYSIIKKYIFFIIEFLLLVREKYNLKDVLVIFTDTQKYISIILKLFPNLNFQKASY